MANKIVVSYQENIDTASGTEQAGSNKDVVGVAEFDETVLPPGYFRSKFFIGSMAGIGLGLMAGVAAYGYAAPILGVINADIGPVSTITFKCCAMADLYALGSQYYLGSSCIHTHLCCHAHHHRSCLRHIWSQMGLRWRSWTGRDWKYRCSDSTKRQHSYRRNHHSGHRGCDTAVLLLRYGRAGSHEISPRG